MDTLDRKLMNLLQEGLPLAKNPYAVVAAQLGVTRQEIAARIEALLREGYIRRLGGAFDTRAMGYTSFLIGLRAPQAQFAAITQHVNACPGVTHNYRRSGFLNMWFTLSVRCEAEKEAWLQQLREKFSLEDDFEFPKKKNFKLHVFFDMESR